MKRSLVPFLTHISDIENLMEDFGENFKPFSSSFQEGLSISEDEKNIYVEAHLPGLDSKEIQITYEKGVLWISGEKKEEENQRKYHRKATSSFSYRAVLSSEIDENIEPEATYEKGVLHITFQKAKAYVPHKIQIKLK